MDKLDRLLNKAKESIPVCPWVEYDFSRLTTEELYELISDTITEERMAEIVEPIKIGDKHG